MELMETASETICRFCGLSAPGGAYYCPNCGKVLREKPQATGVIPQIIAYSVSLFVPPFGLWYAWKYWKQDDEKSKKIAIAALVLTFVSVVGTIWVTEAFLNSFSQTVSGLGF